MELLQHAIPQPACADNIHLVYWIPPTDHWFKLNADECLLGGNPCLAGIYVRSYSKQLRQLDNWLFWFFCGFTFCHHAQLLAIYQGLHLAWNHGIWQVMISQTLSFQWILYITTEVNSHHIYARLINLIRYPTYL